MFKKVAPYIGEYKKYTVLAAIMMIIGIVANVLPYFFSVPDNCAFNKDGDSYRRFGDVVRDYRDFTLAWYKVCWPWMAIYSSVLPCLVLLILPVGSLMVLGGTITLDRLVLVCCMSFAVGPSVLKALNFAGKFPQLSYKITELENLMSHPPLKEGT